MWQVPIIAMTITGGLWFGIGTVSTLIFGVKTLIFFLSFIINCGLIIVLLRIRYVMSEYLNSIQRFHPNGYVEAKGNGRWWTRSRVVITAFSCMLGLSGLMSLLAAFMMMYGKL